MNPEATLLSNAPYLDSLDLVGWLGWFALSLMVIVWVWHSRRDQVLRKQQPPKFLSTNLRQGSIYTLLLLLIPLTALFIILRLSPENLPPAPGHMVDPQGTVLAVLAALPLSIAAGYFGAVPTAIIGAITGLILAGWATHNPFTIVEYALLATALNAASHQPYRTQFYRALRHPLFSAAVLALFYPAISILTISLSSYGNIATRLDYALTLAPYTSVVIAGELILAGLFAEILVWASPASWGNNTPLKPSPVESRLRTRFLYGMIPLAILLIAMLMIGDWVVAGKAAEQLLEQRMASIAQMSAETIPFFVESGQNLIQRLAQDIDWFALSPDEKQVMLQQSLRTVPYFQQLFLLDNHGEEVASLPEASYRQNPTTPPEELAGVDLALHGVPIQSYTIPPISGEQQAQVSFLSTVTADDGTILGVLIGRSELVTNPFIQPVLSSLLTLKATGGEGMLIDGNGSILFHTNYTGLLSPYTGLQPDQTVFYKGKAPDGTGRLYYYQPALGHPWAIVLSIPARQAQQLAVDIAAPLLIMIVILFAAAAVVLRLSLRRLTGSLQNLALEADRISSGQLDNPLQLEGDDEVGQLRRSFERMRVSLKARLDELNRLLVVSQGVAASLEMESAVQPVLEAALSNGACVTRIVLSPSAIPEIEGESPYPTSYGLGPYSEIYSSLDDQILALTRQQERVVITNPSRVRLLNFVPSAPRPEALLAVALRYENTFYGALWLGFDQPHIFTEDEIRFVTTLAGQTALAATNARLFLNAEVGRQRLAGILDSTPDPVLVTDHQNRLLLANPAAWFALDLGIDTSKGLPIEKVIPNRDLARLMRSNADEKQSAEIILPDDRVYLAMASQVMVGNRRVGRVCVLRDVTRFKELDSLKSEFVATVSHDLRSPLTLIRGYTTMLEMVGDLNDQQNSYIRKIISGVETMSRLVNNLLDLGRIEAGIDLQLEMIPIQEIIEGVVNSMQLHASQKHIQLSITPPDTMPVVEADQALLQQALHNLVENAVKYTENGGKVTLHSYVQEDKLILEIEDTGIGIAPVDQPRLFEKFYRGAQRNARKQQGSGLGLAIVKSIAERHGGRVWLESQLGKGSTFFLAIPLRQEQRERLKTP